MNVYVLHLFCDGVLSETRTFVHRDQAARAGVQAIEQTCIGLNDAGEAVDANGSVWSLAVERVEVEGVR